MRSGTPPLFPEAASTIAGRVDGLYLFLVGLTAFMTILIFVLVIVFMVKFKRRDPNSVGARIHGGMALEIIWSVIPLLICLGIFVWATNIFFVIARPPAETMNIYVVGKQWMWKFQHLDGQREINELHVPVGRPVKLIMTSEDVIHDVFVPAFRVKADVIPGRYSHLWFEPTKPGEYHLFCAEYCGTKHSGMIGRVVVMQPDDYQAWLSGSVQEGSLASAGGKLFQDLACNTCHRPDAQGRGPVLTNLFGKQVALQSGEQAVVDEAYLRESILTPGAKVASGFQPVMPSFQGLVSEEGLLSLIEYVKSLKTDAPVQGVRTNSGGPAANENTPAQAPSGRN
ncbi:MAG TPA: cytochrome c oxidase subunit II [Vicinamibacterales bacterium]|nr:cytochrome c oxidase subunit II [Vicinamibacterales bacterium]